jgi:hypothetical protein
MHLRLLVPALLLTACDPAGGPREEPEVGRPAARDTAPAATTPADARIEAVQRSLDRAREDGERRTREAMEGIERP